MFCACRVKEKCNQPMVDLTLVGACMNQDPLDHPRLFSGMMQGRRRVRSGNGGSCERMHAVGSSRPAFYERNCASVGWGGNKK